MGIRIAHDAMKEIIHVGKQKYNLTNIYWNVLKSNKRAIRFYDKNGFKRANDDEFNIIMKIGGEGGTAKDSSKSFTGTVSLFNQYSVSLESSRKDWRDV